MTVTGYLRDKILYINLSGEMDEYTAQEARAKCDRLIEENANAKKVVINLSEVAFMDSTGIGFLIGRYKKASRLAVPLYIENPNFAADKILNLSGIYSLIPKAE
ncbi:MAG: STAS domain-containing protein [Clostridia bacterium]|nr:STAS domain-containing protein [Clostridia bacterium]